jgi:hypothetical protein
MLSVNPGLTHVELGELLKSSADQIDKSGGAYDARGYSLKYGHGRVNAEAAVLAAQAGKAGERKKKRTAAVKRTRRSTRAR